MLLRSAMRYYRLWIYSCNGVLLLSVLVFVTVAAALLADLRMRFVPLPLYHPTLLYAYAALVVQAGVLQTIGCISAIRLHEKWLNVYWLMMLVLLVGDVLVGIIWLFLFGRLTASIPVHMRQRLTAEYGTQSRATALWDRLQREQLCCGVTGPQDYNVTTDPGWMTIDPNATRGEVPDSCYGPVTFWTRGCAEPVVQWVQRSADLLLVLGYCVVAFLKMCFLGILRYEIREMVQKIRMLQGELQALPDLATLGMPSTPNHVDKTPNGNNNELEMKEFTSQL